MAICHFSKGAICRQAGRSAVAAAAYRAAEKLYDERLEKSFNHLKKESDIMYKAILAPDHAPGWMNDREKLWNAVEAADNRKDSRTAVEIRVALPNELTHEQNIALIREFVQTQYVEKGLVADLCVHYGEKVGQEPNPHAHILLGTRVVTEQGFGLKDPDLRKIPVLYDWREEWANTVNRHLAEHEHDVRIDHRSFKDQGINLEPQIKLGPEHAKDRFTERAQTLEEITQRNGERLYQDPGIALDTITKQQSTFSKQDLARFINRQTVDQEQFTRVFERVLASPELLLLGQDDRGRERYSSRKMIEVERNMLQTAQSLSERSTHDLSNPEHDRMSMALSRVGRELKSLFDPSWEQENSASPAAASSFASHFDSSSLSEEQKGALDILTTGNDLSCLVGYAGTGKSYLLGVAKEHWEREGYRVQGMALAGIAARGLANSSGITSHTIANRVIQWDNGREALSERDIVVVDEAGMLGSRQLNRILGEVHQAGAKAVLIGDANQLQPIEAGAAFRFVADQVGFVQMSDIRRQNEVWQQDATRCFAQGEVKEAIQQYEKNGVVKGYASHEDAIQAILERWKTIQDGAPEQSCLMIAYTNREVQELNAMAREQRHEEGRLGQDSYTVDTHKGEREFAEGDRILFLKNNKELDVSNGLFAEIRSIDHYRITAVIDSEKPTEREVTFDTREYNYIDHGYAATVHKAQGATYDHVCVLASTYFDRHTIYTAMSRHKESVFLSWNRQEYGNPEQFYDSLSRFRGKETSLDYHTLGIQLGEERGFVPLSYEDSVRFKEAQWEKRIEQGECSSLLRQDLRQDVPSFESEHAGEREGDGRSVVQEDSLDAERYAAAEERLLHRQFEHAHHRHIDMGLDRLAGIEGKEEQDGTERIERTEGLIGLDPDPIPSQTRIHEYGEESLHDTTHDAIQSRLDLAEERIEHRLFELDFHLAQEGLEEKYGQIPSLHLNNLKGGEHGQYLGEETLLGLPFGVINFEGEIKLLKAEHCLYLEKGTEVVFERLDERGNEGIHENTQDGEILSDSWEGKMTEKEATTKQDSYRIVAQEQEVEREREENIERGLDRGYEMEF